MPSRAFLGAACISLGLHAGELPRFGLPIDCVPGESCWVVNHVDQEAGAGARDYACGAQTYDGHTGTDIAVRNLREMRRGVPVLASAPGTVRAVRDAVADGLYKRGEPREVSGRECGNGVLIEHDGGWQTQYCHLRQGSVGVRSGERVERGARLGLVGQSGRSEFPHLHLAVRHQGRTIDPFTGAAAPAGCAAAREALWAPDAAAALQYRPVSIYDAGVAGQAMSAARVHDGEGIAPARRGSPALVVWAAFYGVAAGDELSLSLADPAGRVLLERRRRIERTQSRRVEFAGLRRTAQSWPAGRYRAVVRVERPRTTSPAGGAALVVERIVAAEIE